MLAVGALAAGVGIAAWATDAFRGAELDTVDARYSIRGEAEDRDGVVVVAVDDVTFNALEEQWPFPRSIHGDLIRQLQEAGAGTIAYDLQFTEPTTPDEDNAVIRAVAAAGNVVLATTEVDEEGNSRVFGGESVLREIGARSANTLTEPDSDGVLRRFPASVQGLESFALTVAQEAGADEASAESIPDDGAWIDYAGPPETIPTVSFSDVLNGEVDPSVFEGKVVVVGASAPSLQDVHPVPIGGAALMAGPEVQANAIATVLAGFPLESAPGWLSVALIALMGFATPVSSLRFQPLLALAIGVGLGVLYLVFAQLAFGEGLILPVVYPIAALIIGAVGMLARHYLLAAFERQRTRDTFARFVPADVVNEVLAQAEDGVRLGGIRRDSTVLFSDIRGFTSYAEELPPDTVVKVLNEYLGQMSDAILDHGGTLVSYMGDGIMAVFGAPIEQPDHADRALAAAREMLEERLPQFNKWLDPSGQTDGFRMGIGLNSGEVLSGQVGSERRMEYTTIGDTTNTAARLEGMTKGTVHQLFLSEATRLAFTGEHELVLVGDLEVRGREATIRVWSTLG